MKQLLGMVILALTGLMPATAFTEDNNPDAKGTGMVTVTMQTNKGVITLELDGDKAPDTVANFVAYANAGHYDGTVFHRVIPGFMVQTGGYTPDYKLREDETTIVNESGNALSNTRGTVAMARTADPHSANSQFFINVADNSRLDPRKDPVRGHWGYTVFGYVIEGMDVVDKIAAAETSPQGEHADAPNIPIVMASGTRICIVVTPKLPSPAFMPSE